MDGTLARVRCQPRPRYGFYVDHMVDVFGAIALMCGLGLSGFLHWQTATAMLVAFLLLSGESYLATYTLSRFELSQGIFGPTELRILLIAGNLALLRSPYSTLFGHRMLLFDLGGTIAAVCMFATAIVSHRAPHSGALSRGATLMNTLIRWGKFNMVGAMGMAVQLSALALFNRMSAGHYLCASAAAIELTLVHNFFWHLNYTWRDRLADGSRVRQFVRFHLSIGVASTCWGNLILMRLLVQEARISRCWPPMWSRSFVARLQTFAWAIIGCLPDQPAGSNTNVRPL